MSKATFEDILRERGELVYTCEGDSMFPLIRQRDLVVIKKWDGRRLRKYDIPLYKRDSGQYVLHRVIRVRRHDYVLCGDNRYKAETGVSDRHILGVLTAIVRNGKTLRLDAPQFRRYAKRLFWRRLQLAMKDRI